MTGWFRYSSKYFVTVVRMETPHFSREMNQRLVETITPVGNILVIRSLSEGDRSLVGVSNACYLS